MKRRARGCFFGQVAGDSLGSLVEFKGPAQIARLYPDGIKELADGGIWDTLAGQPTDDSEMAITLARTILKEKGYNAESVLKAYQEWADDPDVFDIGMTIHASLCYHEYKPESQANGAMMRVSPLGIYGATKDLDTVYALAAKDASLTHINEVCQQSNGLYASLIADSIKTGDEPALLFARMKERMYKIPALEPLVEEMVVSAETKLPENFSVQKGWVKIAFQNALWHLLHTDSFEKAVCDTVMSGGDTDTTAAICGALMGSVYGEEAVPQQWKDAILSCRPDEKNPEVYRPRAKMYWPVDIVDLADALLAL